MTEEPESPQRPSDRDRAWGAGFSRQHHPALTRLEPWSGVAEAGWDVNFLGVKTKVSYFSLFERLADYSSAREVQTSPPVQNEDYFEWVDLLESVLSAKGTFRMIELGAGWGKWMVNGAVAARRAGLDYAVTGVEAEPKHFAWMEDHVEANELDRARATLVCAAVAGQEGEVWFHVGESADWYGQKVEDEPPEESPEEPPVPWWQRLLPRRRAESADARRLVCVRAITLQSLLPDGVVVDLIDSDVQGSEADVFEAARDRLGETVRRVHIGTHSAENEERLRVLFGELGWQPLNDYACGRENETPYGVLAFEDGVQTWLNPRLHGAPP